LILARVTHSQALSESIAVARDAVNCALPACEVGRQTKPNTALRAFSLAVALHTVLPSARLAGIVVKVKTFPTFLAKSCGDGTLFAVGVTALNAGFVVQEEPSFARSTRCGVGALTGFAQALAIDTETCDY
jgi:hypothetical protein